MLSFRTVHEFLKNILGRFKIKQSNPAKDLTMHQVLSVSKPRRFPSWKQWQQLPTVISKIELRVIQTAFLLFIFSLGSLIAIPIFGDRVEIPARGGEYTEALVGEPQLINPLYTTTNDVDQDLVSLIYSGLMRWDPTQGLVQDLAESVQINEEKTVLTFTIKENAQFHNGDPVLARDVLFTINAIQNPIYRSPLFPQFREVSIIQEDDRKISFVLEKPNSAFLRSLTVGILPANAWADILPQNATLAALNLQPIGSGPYKFEKFTKDKKGSIRSYSLKPFDKYAHAPAHIERLNFKFYSDPASALDALANKYVEGASIIPFENRQETRQNRGVAVYSPLLSREVVLFFNQKINETLKQKSVREAIAMSISKESLVKDVLKSEASIITGPILAESVGYHEGLADIPVDIEKAKTLLAETKVIGTVEELKEVEETKKKPNQMTLTTIENEEFLAVASAIKTQLDSVGLNIEIVAVAPEAFFDQVISTRSFELLLTTAMFNTDPDPYVFWHSSQKNSAGLNIVEYQNMEVDKLLEQARTAKNDEERGTALRSFQEKLMADVPAVFLYQSTYGYAVSKKIQNVQLTHLRVPSDRFAQITQWYIKTKKTFK
jgi:peptide/nickel transport system substrate-binding protein